jgi:hypothetical protein
MNQFLEDSLVEFFKHTNVSCAIVKALYDSGGLLKFDSLIQGVNSVLAQSIPDYALEGAVKSALKLLKTTGWVVKEGSEFRLTDLGQTLASKITECKPREI